MEACQIRLITYLSERTYDLENVEDWSKNNKNILLMPISQHFHKLVLRTYFPVGNGVAFAKKMHMKM